MGKVRKFLTVGFSILTIGGSGLAIAKRQDIKDWIILRSYVPTAEISALSERTALSPLGQKLFYVYDPQLLDKDGFNASCTNTEQSIVLGCYDGNGIYLYDITDPNLDGVEEVTSAHEMLHAAYDRLSGDERERIDVLVEQAIASNGSTRILDLVESYRKREPKTLHNEMHSIVGTEIRSLEPELETYFSRYFLNRSAVVDYSEKYEAVFTDLQIRVEQLDADLLTRKAEIDALEESLKQQAVDLEAWQERLQQLKAAGEIPKYNSQVDDFNNALNNYNREVQRARKLVEQYNQKLEERNNLALQQNELINSLDSKAKDL